MKNAIKYIDENAGVIFGKRIFIFILPLLTFLFFHNPLEIFLNKIFVEHFFSKVNSTIWNDIIAIGIFLSLILFYFLKRKNYVASVNVSLALIFLSIIYCYYRFIADLWVFRPFALYPHLKYTDLILIVSVGNIFLWIKNSKTKNLPENGAEAFFDDEPLGENKNDELGYSKYAETLATKIKSSHFDKAFAIGVNGKWGLGKTSFIDLLKRKIGSDLIIVDFNPWNSHTPKAIIQDFFETIQEAIRPYHSSLARLLVFYADKLVALNDNKVTKSIQTSVAAFTGYESLSSLFKDINDALKKINKKIIIFIDDLDRLDTEEIVEVIRLIRNTANFHNTFFIVAYDRNYIVKALHQHNPYNHEQFLEKIFQIEVTLPYFKKDIFRHKLAEKLKKAFPESLHEKIHEEIIGSPSVTPQYLNDWLESMRDVTRLANSLSLNLKKLDGEVVLNDFIRLEVLRFKFPAVYELLFKNPGDFLDFNQRSGDNTYQLKRFNNPQQDIQEKELQFAKTYLQLYLLKNHQALSVPKNQIENIVAFIDGIFDGSLNYGYSSRSHLSVIHPSKFNRYFAYDLLEGNLSEIEFSKTRLLTQKNLNAKISEWIEKGLESEVKNRFARIKAFDNKEDFEKTIRAIFHLANIPRTKTDFFQGNLIGYDGKDLEHKVSDYDNKISENLYKQHGGKESLRAFIKSLFDNAKPPYSFETDFIRYLNHQFSDSFPTTKEELKNLSIHYFKTYCDQVSKLDNSVYRLFHSCKQTEWVPAGGSAQRSQESVPEEAITIMKDFVKKDLDGFLFSWIDFDVFKETIFSVSNFPSVLFGNWQAFEEYLLQQDESKWKYLSEFKQLFSAYKEKNFSVYVPVEFKVIPINEKLRRK
ncbi:MAG: P-loop NTPase fold protein [Bacteroidota bacterium]